MPPEFCESPLCDEKFDRINRDIDALHEYKRKNEDSMNKLITSHEVLKGNMKTNFLWIVTLAGLVGPLVTAIIVKAIS